MDNNDTVPIGVAVAIFVALGILIVAAFIFAGWSFLHLQNVNAGTVLALGKTVDFVEILPDEPEDYEYVEAEPGFTVEIFGGNRMGNVGGEAVFMSDAVVGFPYAPLVFGGEVFAPVYQARKIFDTMGYTASWDEETGVLILANGGNTAVIALDEETFAANGEVLPLTAPARVVDEAAVFPLQTMLAGLGYLSSFDAVGGVLAITEPQPEPEPEPEPTPAAAAPPRPRPAQAPAPEPEPEPVIEPQIVPCRTCGGGGTTICPGCDGIGGGRSMLLTPGIPHEFAESGLQWWCTICMAQTRTTCTTCNGIGTITIIPE